MSAQISGFFHTSHDTGTWRANWSSVSRVLVEEIGSDINGIFSEVKVICQCSFGLDDLHNNFPFG